MPISRSCMPAVLNIQTGLHKGVSVTLGRDTTIGQSAENPVCLLDDGIAEQHVQLTLHRKGLTVTPLSGQVAVNGAAQKAPELHRLAPGRSLEMTFGSIVVSLERPRRKGFGFGHVAALMALIAVCVLLPLPWRGATQSAALAVSAPASGHDGAVRASASASLHLEAFSQKVGLRFAELGLDRTMKISVTGSGDRPLSTTISGIVEPDNVPTFEAFLAWYDAQPARPALFNMTTRELPKDKELPRIASILLQPVPGLITDSGRHFEVGEELPGGWILSSVDNDTVVLTLDGQSRVISLGRTTGPTAP